MGKIQTLYGNTLIVKVFPRSKVLRIEEMLDDGTLKVRLRSPPEGGQANEELLLLLEKTTGEKWKILRGKTMHRKHVGKIL